MRRNWIRASKFRERGKKIESHLLDGSKMEDRLRSARVSFLFIYIREEARGVRGEGFVGWQIRAGAEKGACKNRK